MDLSSVRPNLVINGVSKTQRSNDVKKAQRSNSVTKIVLFVRMLLKTEKIQINITASFMKARTILRNKRTENVLTTQRGKGH